MMKGQFRPSPMGSCIVALRQFSGFAMRVLMMLTPSPEATQIRGLASLDSQLAPGRKSHGWVCNDGYVGS